jgi:hypothetical protein
LDTELGGEGLGRFVVLPPDAVVVVEDAVEATAAAAAAAEVEAIAANVVEARLLALDDGRDKEVPRTSGWRGEKWNIDGPGKRGGSYVCDDITAGPGQRA